MMINLAIVHQPKHSCQGHSLYSNMREKKTFKGNTVKEQNRLVARAVVLPELKELE